MPSTQQLYGIDAEIQAKLDAKYSSEDQAKVVQWIQQVTGKQVGSIYPGLKSGVALCALLNKIKPGTIHSFYPEPKSPLFERENIKHYIDGCAKLGVQPQDLFMIGDLHDGKMLSSVIQNLYSLGRQAQVVPGFQGPHFGVKYSVTLEEQALREEKKKQEREQEEKRIVAREERQKSRREEVENETKLEHLEQEKKNEEIQLSRRYTKGRISENDYKLERQKSEEKFRRLSLDLSNYEINNSEILFGMDRETHQKMVSKRYTAESLNQQFELMDWIESMVGDPIDDFHLGLKSGVILCKLLNKIRPGIIKKIDTRVNSARFGPSVSRDNIKLYLEKCAQIGMPPSDLFNISDLYDNRDSEAVLKHLSSMKRRYGNLTDQPPSGQASILMTDRKDIQVCFEPDNTTGPILPTHVERDGDKKDRPSFFQRNRKVLLFGGLLTVGVLGGLYLWANQIARPEVPV